MLSTSFADTTASVSSDANSAIFLRMSVESSLSLRHRSMSGWMPMRRSSLTECCVGFVFSSPAWLMYGTSVRCMYIHLTLVPYISHAGELKTKPTQHSVNELRRIGIQPDMLLCRSESELSTDIRKKIALFASLPVDAVVSAKDVDNIYKVPPWFAHEGVDAFICEHFGIETPEADLGEWREVIERAETAEDTVRIPLVGKYVALEDAYL